MVLKKKKIKFRVNKFKEDKNFKNFNISEINLFLKIKGYNIQHKKKSTFEKTNQFSGEFKKQEKEKLKKNEEGFDFILTDDGEELYIEKDLVKLRIKKWKFLNFAEYKLWSILYDIWKDIEFDFRFTRYKHLFAGPIKGFKDIQAEEDASFDEDSENAILYDFIWQLLLQKQMMKLNMIKILGMI